MGEDNKSKLYLRPKENWFKGLLIKLKIIEPKWKELGVIKSIEYKGEEDGKEKKI